MTIFCAFLPQQLFFLCSRQSTYTFPKGNSLSEKFNPALSARKVGSIYAKKRSNKCKFMLNYCVFASILVPLPSNRMESS